LFEHQFESERPGSSPKFSSPDCVGPCIPIEAEVSNAFGISKALIVVGLYLRPVKAPAPIFELAWSYAKGTPFDRLYPGGMAEAKVAGAFDKSVPFIVKRLYHVPMVNSSWHAISLTNVHANGVVSCAMRSFSCTFRPAQG
jgi:hypothetical protein